MMLKQAIAFRSSNISLEFLKAKKKYISMIDFVDKCERK